LLGGQANTYLVFIVLLARRMMFIFRLDSFAPNETRVYTIETSFGALFSAEWISRASENMDNHSEI